MPLKLLTLNIEHDRHLERVAETIELVESKRDWDGRWLLENHHPGTMPIEMDEGEGRPSRWNTLRALRVLDWYSRA